MNKGNWHYLLSLITALCLIFAYFPLSTSAAAAAEGGGRITVRDITPDFSDSIAEKYEINNDVIGWLTVPGTGVNDVILQNPPQTNQYYLVFNINKRPDKNGLFCADNMASLKEGTRENLSGITALFGHSWDDNPDGELFASLKKYRNPKFAREHPYIFFSTGQEKMAWEVFAVFDTNTNLPYIDPNLSEGDFMKTIELINKLSLYDYGINITATDKLLTLSTCTYSVKGHAEVTSPTDYRFAIMARLVDPKEAVKFSASFTVNPDPMPPDDIPGMMKELELIWL